MRRTKDNLEFSGDFRYISGRDFGTFSARILFSMINKAFELGFSPKNQLFYVVVENLIC